MDTLASKLYRVGLGKEDEDEEEEEEEGELGVSLTQKQQQKVSLVYLNIRRSTVLCVYKQYLYINVLSWHISH